MHGTPEMQLIRFVTTTFGQIASYDVVINNGFIALTLTQRGDQGQSFLFLILKHFEACVLPFIDRIGLGSHESR